MASGRVGLAGGGIKCPRKMLETIHIAVVGGREVLTPTLTPTLDLPTVL